MTKEDLKDFRESIGIVWPAPDHFLKRIKKAGFTPGPDTVFAFGHIVYSRRKLIDHVFEHELVHCSRQIEMEGGPEEWWRRYLTDPDFRYEEEVLAYRKQYRYFKNKNKDKNQALNFARHLANELSGPLYGFIVKFPVALKEITRE